VALGYYHLAMPALQSLSMVTIAVIMGWVVIESGRGNKAARLYLLAFSFFYFGVVWRYLRNVGWVEPNFWNDNAYQIGAFVHMLLMSVGIFASYNRLRRDKEQAESRADAEARMRLEQRDFMAMLSHELRTPLTIMGASVDNLLDDAGLSHPARQRVEKVQRASERMRQLVENYLSSERLMLEKEQQVLTLAPCDLARLCQQIHDEVADQDGASLTLALPPSLMVWCDKELLRIAITNLVGNARRYSPADTSVALKLELTGGVVHVLVQDQGPGIVDSERAHLFKRFFRGQHALHLQGTGLGLYLAQAIAKRHGGSVSVRNLAERGCEFCLRLPDRGDQKPQLGLG
jgi:signal transduction histidine kinase